MPSPTTTYRLFIASPSGLENERRAFREQVTLFSQRFAVPKEINFVPVFWEDVHGGVGRPQDVINQVLKGCDYFVLVMADRWGSPPDSTGAYSSASEEEFRLAESMVASGSLRDILILFKGLPARQLADPGPQLKKVLRFRRVLDRQRKHLFKTYDSLKEFRSIVDDHLAHWLRACETGYATVSPGKSAGVRGSSRVARKDETDPYVESGKALERAVTLARRGLRTEAEVLFARAIFKHPTAGTLLEYGRFLIRDGRVGLAQEILENALELSQRSKADLRAAIHRALGTVHKTQGRSDRAEVMYREALRCDEQSGNLEGIARDYGNIGVILQARGDSTGAEKMFMQALEANHKLGRNEGVAKQYGNLGNLFLDREEWDLAEHMLTHALDMHLACDDVEGAASSYVNLGNLFAAREDVVQAESMYLKALAESKNAGWQEGVIISLLNLAIGADHQSHRQRAIQYAGRAATIAKQLGMPHLLSKAESLLADMEATISPTEDDAAPVAGMG
jgi:tetratricopeptide (TPR) repeat protein